MTPANDSTQPGKEQKAVHPSPKLARWPFALVAVCSLSGCQHAPSFNIVGSFFPAWLICMVTGIVLAAIVHWTLAALKRENFISWGIVVYPCLAAFFAFTIWLLIFG